LLPSTLTELLFDAKFNQPLTPGSLPQPLLELAFEQHSVFNHPIPPNTLPTTLTSLSFGSAFQQPLQQSVLPPSLTSLMFGEEYKQSITPGILPTSLLKLSLGRNELTPRVLPDSLTYLVLSESFKGGIANGSLPQSLTSLNLGGYNKKITTSLLPQSLKTLIFGKWYNKPLDHGVVPSSVTRLAIGQSHSQPKDKVGWPASLRHLTLGTFKHFRYEGALPTPVRSIGIREFLFPDHKLSLSLEMELDELYVTCFHPTDFNQVIGSIKLLIKYVPNVGTYHLMTMDRDLIHIRRYDDRNAICIHQSGIDYIHGYFGRLTSPEVHAFGFCQPGNPNTIYTSMLFLDL
ncbi:hypothetical protein SAMD00019534_076040, partial [Acytostelium subglobosum LB1]|uniref:hypothetical protein n=1 Tax=Acytostelium subglobosum LB1 TaxID=1410327 RepID=UPI000644E3EA